MLAARPVGLAMKGDLMFARGFLLALLPLAGLVTPLFFHRSSVSDLGPYSHSYSAMLAAAIAILVSASTGLGWLCRRNRRRLGNESRPAGLRGRRIIGLWIRAG